MNIIFLFIILLATSFNAFTNENNDEKILPVGKVNYIRGSAYRNESLLDINSEIFEGDTVRTLKSSVVKIMMINEAIITIAPKSVMIIEQYIREDENLIHLLKGVIRAKVVKNPTSKENSLIIKSSTAALGVRGTDFQFTYNTENKVSSVLTYDGIVGFKRIKSSKFNYNDLNNELAKSNTYEVTKGEYSANNIKTGKINIPTRISISQYHALKKNKIFKRSFAKQSTQKKYRSIIPAGAPSKSFKSKAFVPFKTKMKKISHSDGFYSTQTEEFSPAAGGYLDSTTGIYIEPDSKSAFNNEQQSYSPSPEVGTINPKTGEYLPPKGFKLTPKGEFTPIRKDLAPFAPKINFNPKSYSQKDRLISNNQQSIKKGYEIFSTYSQVNNNNSINAIQQDINQQNNQANNNQTNTTQLIINIREK
jgi:hypothetical protein